MYSYLISCSNNFRNWGSCDGYKCKPSYVSDKCIATRAQSALLFPLDLGGVLLRSKGEELSPFPLSKLLGCAPVEQPFNLYAVVYFRW